MAAVVDYLAATSVDDFAAPAVPMADFYPHHTAHQVQAIAAGDDDPQLVTLVWDDGVEQTWHALVLRESCACRTCRHDASLERTADQDGYPLDVRPARWRQCADGDLEVTWWPDGHVSRFTAGWLRNAGQVPAPTAAPATWGADMATRLQRFAYPAVRADQAAMLAWLQALRDDGIAYLDGAPCTPGTLRELLNQVAHVRETNFGVLFDVTARPDANSNAYTAIELGTHVDLPSREYQPGFQFLHCLVNDAAGGASLYADGFRLAERLQAEDPDAYAVLSQVPVRFRFVDEETDYEATAPMIRERAAGGIDEIRFNPALMTWPVCRPRDVAPFYRAYRRLLALSRGADDLLEVTMAAGQIACFDNRRVLHGRRAFDPGQGHRHLQGGYLEREDLMSRLRVLQRAGARAG